VVRRENAALRHERVVTAPEIIFPNYQPPRAKGDAKWVSTSEPASVTAPTTSGEKTLYGSVGVESRELGNRK